MIDNLSKAEYSQKIRKALKDRTFSVGKNKDPVYLESPELSLLEHWFGLFFPFISTGSAATRSDSWVDVSLDTAQDDEEPTILGR